MRERAAEDEDSDLYGSEVMKRQKVTRQDRKNDSDQEDESELSEGEIQRRMEEDELNKMKRDMMRLGEDHLYARYTNLKKKQ